MDVPEILRRIKFWRVWSGLTLTEIAAGIGCERSLPGKWEAGQTPSLRSLVAFWGVIGIGPSKFFGPLPKRRRDGGTFPLDILAPVAVDDTPTAADGPAIHGGAAA
jgi:hypothetical protein